jgi:hypothetical protein
MSFGLLTALLVLSAGPARAAPLNVEVAPRLGEIRPAPAPLVLSAPVPSLSLAASLVSAAPALSVAPVVSWEAAPAAQAADVSPGAAGPQALANAESEPVLRQTGKRERSAAVAAAETAAALRYDPGRAAEPAPDLLARDYSVPGKKDVKRMVKRLQKAGASGHSDGIVRGIFSGDRKAQTALTDVMRNAAPDNVSAPYLMAEIYNWLRYAYFLKQASDARIGVSSRLHDSTARFLDRVARDLRLPDEARSLAHETRARYLTDDQLLAAFAWGLRLQRRIAAARLEAAAAYRGLSEGSDEVAGDAAAGRSDAPRGISASAAFPGPDVDVPADAGKGVTRETVDLNEFGRGLEDSVARFRLARARWNLSKSSGLRSASMTDLEQSSAATRWWSEIVDFNSLLSRYENRVGYLLDNTFRMNFSGMGRVRGRLLHPPHPSLSLRADADGYLLRAAFETRIQDPEIVAFLRDAIERHWTLDFDENGRSKRFATAVTIRVLRPDEAYSEDALLFVERESGSSWGATDGTIYVPLNFLRAGSAAHEFGHLMGLPDEYVDDYSPESMRVFKEHDNSSLMSNPRQGRLLPRHLAQLIDVMRRSGRLDPADGR